MGPEFEGSLSSGFTGQERPEDVREIQAPAEDGPLNLFLVTDRGHAGTVQSFFQRHQFLAAFWFIERKDLIDLADHLLGQENPLLRVLDRL